MDTAQWPQGLGLVKPMEDLVSSTSTANNHTPTTTTTTRPQQLMERRVRPQKEQALNCPRCNSTNTKFCYYNNYSLTQPRYFCKTCRRYWTEGGSLRNVPVGGGSRKNKRSTSSSTTTPSTTTTATTTTSSTLSSSSIKNSPHDHLNTLPLSSISLSTPSSQNPKFHEGQDLNLAFPLAEFAEHYPNIESHSSAARTGNSSNPSNANSGSLSAMELLRSGMSGRAMGPFSPMNPISIPEYSAGFGVQDFRSNTLSFPLDGVGGTGGAAGGSNRGYGSLQGVQEGGGRLLFPFGDTRHVSSNANGEFEQNRGQGGGDPPGFWNGMIGGGSW